MESKARERIEREIGDALHAAAEVNEARRRFAAESAPLVAAMEQAVASLEGQTDLDPYDLARIREQIIESRLVQLESDLTFQHAIIDLEAVLGVRLRDIAHTPH